MEQAHRLDAVYLERSSRALFARKRVTRSGPSATLTPAISRLPAALSLSLAVSTFIGILLYFAEK